MATTSRWLAVALISLTTTGAVLAQPAPVTFNNDRAAFEAANPGLQCGDFSAAVLIGDTAAFPAPLDAQTDNAVFSPGDILPGIAFRDNPLNDDGGGGPDGLGMAAAGNFGADVNTLVANIFADSFEVVFPDGVNAAGFDLVNYFTDAVTVEVAVFDMTDSEIGATMAPATNASGSFLGIAADVPIGRIEVFNSAAAGGDGAEGVANYCFGDAGPVLVTPKNIPTLQGFGLVILLLLLTGVAVIRLQRG